MGGAYGPSSRESYSSRERSGPPAYVNVPRVTERRQEVGGEGLAGEDELPAYTSTPTSNQDVQHNRESHQDLLSAEEEKARLHHLEEQNRQTESDAAIAQTLTNEKAQTGQ